MYSPRIYLYKITFEEVPYYYYGIKKEEHYNQKYWGSPKTNKWCWELYTPKKQILEVFPYTDEGWMEALEVEKRLIKPFFNADKWCLNEHCGGKMSLDILRENGRKNSRKSIEERKGIFSLTKEELSEAGKIGGKKVYELGLGIHSFTTEERREMGKRSGEKLYQLGLGIHSLTTEDRKKLGEKTGKENYILKRGWFALTNEERKEVSSKSGKKTYELKIGIHGRSKEQMTENGKIGGKISGQKTYEQGIGIHGQSKEKMTENGKKGVKIVNSQKWMCLETGYVSTAAGVVSYQKGRKIDTSKSNRKQIS